MACPGGCLGGGGQPVPTNKEIREKRAKAIYQEDECKTIKWCQKERTGFPKIYLKGVFLFRRQFFNLLHNMYFQYGKETIKKLLT